MRLVTFQTSPGSLQPGVLLDDSRVLSLVSAGYPGMLEFIAAGDSALAAAGRLLAAPPAGAIYPLEKVRLKAPVPGPGKILLVGLNYRDHAAESNMEIPKVPTVFAKLRNTVIGPGEPIVLPRKSEKPDYEAEFAFVVGKGGRHMDPNRWKEHVFGYLNLNDVSARDFQLSTTQWLLGKSCDTFCPMGPWIVTPDEIADPHQLDVSMTVNGEVLQHSNTRELIFRIPDLLAYVSQVMTLDPGDIISTGTPSGVGFARKPPRFLRPGDECVVEVQGLGQLRNPVAAE
jgi:2-keto-4-pentenoate hydratase/2-oxohepta-3-ene-1,7-dioic acid hydratase in catechol pathway